MRRDPANFFARVASAIAAEDRQTATHNKAEQVRDDRICAICDGGPGNQGVCLCGHHAYGENNKNKDKKNEQQDR